MEEEQGLFTKVPVSGFVFETMFLMVMFVVKGKKAKKNEE